MIYEISTSSSEETQQVAAQLAKHLKGSEVIELISDLGGGKTAFVQGLAQAMGYTGEVTSPTFTLSQIYKISSSLELHHYDLYRLGQSGVVGDELLEDLATPHIVTAIEWAGVVEAGLPRDRLRVEIEVTGDTSRKLIFKAGGPESARLIEGIKS